MEFVQTYFTQQLPAYLQQLPIPDTFGGFMELSGDEALQIAPLFVLLFSLVLMMFLHLLPSSDNSQLPSSDNSQLPSSDNSQLPSSDNSQRINTSIKLKEAKVVDKIDFEGEQLAFCRCWKSKKFPYCDGSHTAHNKATGDNVGPLIVKKKAQ
eukprot:TRINITY_DN10075_c0_g2_i1.p1 TRINITY_DN10075_c0_g2~~TRINITY_DN10075_c0_g2_i1.p1  ORF type:complete len:175 (+),score=28.15 TRINITY_DN10075_c0_g2_i1:67-525(+)